MKITLNSVCAVRGEWSLSASGTFSEGIHLISGKSGSGKSTLALVLSGLFSSFSGTVALDGVSSVMVSFQFPEYHITGLTLKDECRSWGLNPSTVLSSVKLYGKKDLNPLKLSRGELKRLNMACVLSGKYDLLILDEPFGSLDVQEKERVCHDLSLRKKGITIITTHERTLFPRVDHLWEIQNGELRCLGRLPEALGAWQNAPGIIKNLIAAGRTPYNISPEDLLEAACRT
jgi:energy-coupling factor transport system ATP-binding protein